MSNATFRLEDVASVRTGDGAPQDSKVFCDTGVPFIRAGSLSVLLNGKSENELEKISPIEVKKRRMAIFPAGTVVFAKSGMSCTKGYVYQLQGDCCVVNHLAAIRCGPSLDSSFLLRWLEKNSPSRLIANAAYPSIKISTIREDQVDLPVKNGKPDIEEQKRIAAILDKADAIRRKRRQALQLTDDFLRSLFLDMFGDPVTNPKGWDLQPFGAMITEGPQNGLYKHSDDYGSGTRILRIDGFYSGSVTSELSLKRVRATKEEQVLYSLDSDDIVINRVNSLPYLGKRPRKISSVNWSNQAESA